jgi:peptidyl-prolyl cis-trans isomerase D
MLQSLHEKTSGLFAKILLGIITIVFGGFFGTQQFGSSHSANYVAAVNGQEITQNDFRERWDAYRNRITRQFGNQVDMSQIDTPERRRQLLDQMIDEQLLLDSAQKQGAVVPKALVQQEILSVPAFQVDGKFNPAAYQQFLAQSRKSADGFDEDIRRDLLLQQTDQQLLSSAFVSSADVDNYIRLRDQTRDLRYVTLPKPAASDVTVADADVDAYYKAHGDEFMTAEKVSLDYIELDASKIKSATSVDDETLKKQYEAQKSHYVTNEQRLASHILVKVDKNANADAQKAALEKAKGIEDQLKSGKDFATLAKSDSDDTGSKAQGGDLGWLEKGVTDPAFESALFALKKGDVSDPVKSDEGYHIIQLRDIKPEKVKPFEQVKAELASKYLEGEREREYSDISGRLTDAVYQDPTSLDAAAKQFNLPVQKTGLFTRTGGEGIAADPKVLKAAFSTAVLTEGNASDPLDIGPSHVVIIKVDQHQKAEPKPLDQVRDDIKKKLVDQQIAKAAHERADTLFARIGQGESLDKIAGELKLKVEDQKDIGRNASNVDRKLVDDAFKLDRPAEGKPTVGESSLSNGDFALIELTAVKDGDPSKIDAKTKEAARNTLRQGMGGLAVRGYVDSLRKSAKIEVAEDRLQ